MAGKIETRYAIDCTRNSTGYVAYVGDDECNLSTHWIEEAKLWKTRRGAEEWMARRPGFKGAIVTVEMRRGIRGGLIPAIAA